MGPRRRTEELRRAWRPRHALLAVPILLLAVIVTVDALLPAQIHLGPLLIVAPALTASFAGPVLTAVVGVLAVAALVGIGLLRGVLDTDNLQVQIAAIVVVSALVTLFCLLRQRRAGELAQVRRVALAAQQAVVRPLPRHIGPLRTACFYLAAEDHAQIGGDLYAAVRTGGRTRLIIGDVMGKGVEAIGDSALLLGAFREAGHRVMALPDLMTALEASVRAGAAMAAVPDRVAESFITALVVDVPDDRTTAEIIGSGHPPPLLVRGGRVSLLEAEPSCPLGLGDLAVARPAGLTFSFEVGDVLLLYTDGVTEARDPGGAFYPLQERAAQWARQSPHALVHHLRDDLLAFADGRLGDDAAVVAVERTWFSRSRGAV